MGPIVAETLYDVDTRCMGLFLRPALYVNYVASD